MAIKRVAVSSFRSFDSSAFDLSSGLNVVLGENGSGKTSLLEGIYVFAYGRSFRTHQSDNLIKRGDDAATVFVKSFSDDVFGWTRSSTSGFCYHANKKQLGTHALAQKFMPCLFIDASSHRAFTKQSVYRRQLLDWGVYHSNHDFCSTWNIYQRALKQRNAALKSRVALKEIRQWDSVLVEQAEVIKKMRSEYIENLKVYFDQVVATLAVNKLSPKLTLSHGWQGSYESALFNALEDDLRVGYTTVGPHRGKVDMLVGSVVAKNQASEGQQKLLHYALRLAQAYFLFEVCDKKVVFLIDDIGAELDQNNQIDLINQYSKIEAQLIITAISSPPWVDRAEKLHQL